MARIPVWSAQLDRYCDQILRTTVPMLAIYRYGERLLLNFLQIGARFWQN